MNSAPQIPFPHLYFYSQKEQCLGYVLDDRTVALICCCGRNNGQWEHHAHLPRDAQPLNERVKRAHRHCYISLLQEVGKIAKLPLKDE